MLTDAPPVKVKWNDEEESAAHKVKMNRCCSTWTPSSQQEEPVAEVKECYYPRGQVGRTMKLVSEFLEGTFMVSGNALRVVSSGLAIVLVAEDPSSCTLCLSRSRTTDLQEEEECESEFIIVRIVRSIEFINSKSKQRILGCSV